MKLAEKIKILLLSFFLLFSLAQIAEAKNLQDAFLTKDGSKKNILDSSAETAGYNVETTKISTIISSGIKMMLSILGVVFLMLILYGGYLWMSDQGNEEQVAKAQKLITAAVIGLIIVVSAYAISWFVNNALQEKTLDAGVITHE